MVLNIIHCVQKNEMKAKKKILQECLLIYFYSDIFYKIFTTFQR